MGAGSIIAALQIDRKERDSDQAYKLVVRGYYALECVIKIFNFLYLIIIIKSVVSIIERLYTRRALAI